MSGPVLRYIDEIAVERARKGDRTVCLNRWEVAEAHAYLRSHGYSNTQIARILGVTARTVVRWNTGRHFPLSRTTSGRLAERRGLTVGKAS